ncbi:PsbP-related protein [uncultured Duncaniella sp.]|uniref:PsbP-related protein n=1 Tax=uncultured Duncaniella sp. TaxID=2768039 RepID=UPI002600A8CD|nr:PsbP-related protein [uncultured Duncaniella sp.]
MMKLFLFILALIAILNFSGCSSNDKRLGYESENSPIEYESNAVVENCDSVMPPEAYDDDNIVDTTEFEGTPENKFLSEIYSNSKFSIRYPSNWEVVQENAQATVNTTIAVQIMQKVTNEYDFRPNVNIIVSKDKRTETTASLARVSYNQASKLGFTTNLIGIRDCQVNGKNGSIAEYIATVEGYKLHIYQYIVKKKDNSTFVITMTLDHNNLGTQKSLSQQIIDSIKIF